MLGKIVADDMLIVSYFSDKEPDISCESSASQTIHMKCQALFSLKKKKRKQKQQQDNNYKQITDCVCCYITTGALRGKKTDDYTVFRCISKAILILLLLSLKLTCKHM